MQPLPGWSRSSPSLPSEEEGRGEGGHFGPRHFPDPPHPRRGVRIPEASLARRLRPAAGSLPEEIAGLDPRQPQTQQQKDDPEQDRDYEPQHSLLRAASPAL